MTQADDPRPVVAHFVRKSTHFRASFIKNQVESHQRYRPVLAFREFSRRADGGFASFDLEGFPCLDLSPGHSWLEEQLFRRLFRIGRRDVDRALEFLRAGKARVLHFHYGTDAGMYAQVMRRSGLPSVASFYGYDCSSFPRMLWGYGGRFLRATVFRHATRVLAMSRDMERLLLEAGCPPEKIVVHYYGTDVDRFLLPEDFERPGREAPVLLTVSSLQPYKGHLFLLRALAKLAASGGPDFRLRILGDGELAGEIRDFVAQNGLEGRVTMLGMLEYASGAFMEEFRQADVLCHTSVTAPGNVQEGIPGALVEGMASGLPVVSTYHAGIPSVVETERTGLLAREWDVDALADALARVLSSAELRRSLGRAARRHAVEHLRLQDRERHLEALYDRLRAEAGDPDAPR
ncbi:N-acetyl-alpha-D-glucosaminyl L-malate synthase [Fundidesulfovibrio magnetotacticus]|uniref:N-acetyl-alpha-D-glucosaminyl L-malate synthase n=1 Tax=Fundidesulfovibrio magnetotacticus TaxID=2730080 RepID=A0A6V8LNI8_9BACT|nr:glycosyltransferase [Fundidesulfovibrio magnetotacticus]GFK94182.1 N-acetyl-alpha-D-glucosaminyl L-malate synthase [Fundidesulfovibrio magnetotacticus]